MGGKRDVPEYAQHFTLIARQQGAQTLLNGFQDLRHVFIERQSKETCRVTVKRHSKSWDLLNRAFSETLLEHRYDIGPVVPDFFRNLPLGLMRSFYQALQMRRKAFCFEGSAILGDHLRHSSSPVR